VRERLLTQHFFQRFLENDLLSPDADRHDALAMIGGLLLTLGMFLSIAVAMQFLFMPFQSPFRTALPALGDRLMFVALAMTVMSLVAVLTWEALSLDPRDTAIFGPLPIERGVIVRAKLRAVGLLAAGFALAISSTSSLFHPVLMVAKLKIGLIAACALVVIHLVVMLAAGLFAFGCVFMLREILHAVLGMRFTRISAALQAVLIVGLMTSFLLLPAILGQAARTDSRMARMLPIVWFAGLHEALAGDLVVGLPPSDLPPSVARQEDGAAVRYREISATIRPLAWRAVTSLGVTLAIAVTAFFWNSRQLPLPLVGNRATRYRGPGLLTRALTLVVVRRPAAQAGFFFTLQCLLRSGPHRVVMAACTAVSLAVATVLLGAAGRSPQSDAAGVPGYVFSTQTIVLAVLLAGFRHVTRLPADIRASRLFRLAWVADSSWFLSGVRRGAIVGVVLPAIVILVPPSLYLLGARLALMHALTGLLLSVALVSLMTLNASRLPFVASYAPASDLNITGPAILIGGMIAVSLFSWLERTALADVRLAAVLWAVMIAVAVIPQLMAGHNTQLDLPTAFDVPAAGATRLDLG
jgi:hypothetical protein